MTTSPTQRAYRLRSMRAFSPYRSRRSAREVREKWAALFDARGPDHPYWVHVHIPFCPQTCSYCQCSRKLLSHEEELREYLAWLHDEIRYFADVGSRGLVRFQYLGGGTPNMLSDAQLEALFAELNRGYRYHPEARRTFELLPSALREGTLELVRAAGFNRLSFGVQSTNDATLERFHRDYASPTFVGDIVSKGFELGFDEINLDLIWGLRGDAAEQFERSLLDTLARRPTTVTIHHIVPTTTNRPFMGTDEEVASHTRFRQLDRELGPLVEREAPGYVWVYRSDCWALVERGFLESGVFGPWYYSDNERLHIDMMGLGRFAHSRILGQLQYEDLPASVERFDPEAPSFSVFVSNPIIDGGMDLLAGLIGDRVVDLEEIRERYAMPSTETFDGLLLRLAEEGVVEPEARAGGAEARWRFLPDEHIFLQHLMPVVGLIEEQAYQENPVPSSEDDVRRGLRAELGNAIVQVRVERARSRERYYAQVGPFGLSYAVVSRQEPARHLVEGFMASAVALVERLLEGGETLSSGAVAAALEAELCAPTLSPSIPA